MRRDFRYRREKLPRPARGKTAVFKEFRRHIGHLGNLRLQRSNPADIGRKRIRGGSQVDARVRLFAGGQEDDLRAGLDCLGGIIRRRPRRGGGNSPAVSENRGRQGNFPAKAKRSFRPFRQEIRAGKPRDALGGRNSFGNKFRMLAESRRIALPFGISRKDRGGVALRPCGGDRKRNRGSCGECLGPSPGQGECRPPAF